MKLFQCAVLLHPNEQGKKMGHETKILVEPCFILARDQHTAMFKAFNMIPEENRQVLDCIEVAVRPF